jgi:hypothetical protein
VVLGREDLNLNSSKSSMIQVAVRTICNKKCAGKRGDLTKIKHSNKERIKDQTKMNKWIHLKSLFNSFDKSMYNFF